MLAALPLKDGKFLYVNPEYIHYIDPTGEDYCDVCFGCGILFSVECDAATANAMLTHWQESMAGGDDEVEG